jgi:hypothetical protein
MKEVEERKNVLIEAEENSWYEVFGTNHYIPAIDQNKLLRIPGHVFIKFDGAW